MHNSDQENQDQRGNTAMEDSTGMTVEFLRARLLSERQISRTARQRADELAKRVAELEEQLKIVSLQRKKAEKATADVLAILENHGISDASEAYDSSSDQEVTPRESKVGNDSMKEEESSVNSKMSRNDTEEFSGSEHESSPLPGRSLSWKSRKDSLHSREKKNVDSSTRRRSSLASSSSSSPKHRLGKSCRQIRRRETRSVVEELKIDGVMLDPQSNGVATCSDGGPEILREGCGIQEEKILLEGIISGGLENQRKVTNAGQFLKGHGGDKDMERALEHQAQLIGRFEAEEKAQREWEEKFRENNSSTPDSCEPGNQSDVTDERDEIKTQAPYPALRIASQRQEAKSEADGIGLTKDSSKSYPNSFQPPSHVDVGCEQDQKHSSTLAYESPAPEFAFPMAKEKQKQELLEHDSPANQSAHNVSSSHVASDSYKGENFGTRNENRELIPHEAPSKLGGVLDALQQARLSLQHKLNSFPLLESESVGKAIELSVPAMRAGDKVQIPVGYAGLFRVPTDFKSEAISQSNFRGSGSHPSLTNSYPDTGVAVSAGDRFVPSPHFETRSNVSSNDRFVPSPYLETRMSVSSSDRFASSPYRDTRLSVYCSDQFAPSPYRDTRLSVPSSDRFASSPYRETRLSVSGGDRFPASPYAETGSRVSTQKPYFDPYLDTGLPSSSKYTYPTYPSFPHSTPQMSYNEEFPRTQMPYNEEFSRTIPSRAGGTPPADHFSFYNDHIRPNMYR